MQIGEVIRKYRKEKNMTQEEMANRLGVTAPAVNKWEKGTSMPDIMLLAPIARLLDISVDELLSFQEELTDQEINELVKEVSERLKSEDYETVFKCAKKQMEKFPNCEHLLLSMTVTLDANRLVREVPNADSYDNFYLDTYARLLESNEEYVKTAAADSLYGFYMRKEEYEKAEKYLDYFSMQNPERKRKQAFLYDKAGRTEEAYKAYEELLFSEYQIINVVLNSMFMMSMRENNPEKAKFFVEKVKQLVKVFEMGEYREYSAELELLQQQKDVEGMLECVEHMLSGIDTMNAFADSPLYEHMTFKEISEEFKETLKADLLKCFRDEESFGYMKADPRWEKLLEQNN